MKAQHATQCAKATAANTPLTSSSHRLSANKRNKERGHRLSQRAEAPQTPAKAVLQAQPRHDQPLRLPQQHVQGSTPVHDSSASRHGVRYSRSQLWTAAALMQQIARKPAPCEEISTFRVARRTQQHRHSTAACKADECNDHHFWHFRLHGSHANTLDILCKACANRGHAHHHTCAVGSAQRRALCSCASMVDSAAASRSDTHSAAQTQLATGTVGP